MSRVEHKVLPYGGQAVIEGVMMRSENAMAVAVRRPDGRLQVRLSPWRRIARSRLWRRPFLRGGIVLVESLMNGWAALNFSAEVASADEQGKAGRQNSCGGWAVVVFSLLLAVGLFVALPHFLVWLAGRAAGIELTVEHFSFHLLAGLAKLAVFLGYLGLLSHLPDVKRLFAYHGAEHQSIHALEAGEKLQPTAIERFSTTHPRCGTAFIILVIAVSILVFSLVFPLLIRLMGSPTGRGWLDQVIFVLIKLPLLLPIAALAFEIQKLTARHLDSFWVLALALPGLWLQKLTTRQPDAAQREVALTALLAVLAAPAGAEPAREVIFEDFTAARSAYGGDDHA
jgi:uncharacterized protein YqhQ